MVSRANVVLQLGQVHGSFVKSLLIRSLKHFTNAPLPPFLYLKRGCWHCLQNISMDLVGAFDLGLAKRVPIF